MPTVRQITHAITKGIFVSDFMYLSKLYLALKSFRLAGASYNLFSLLLSTRTVNFIFLSSLSLVFLFRKRFSFSSKLRSIFGQTFSKSLLIKLFLKGLKKRVYFIKT